jgi:hypothetical protein
MPKSNAGALRLLERDVCSRRKRIGVDFSGACPPGFDVATALDRGLCGDWRHEHIPHSMDQPANTLSLARSLGSDVFHRLAVAIGIQEPKPTEFLLKIRDIEHKRRYRTAQFMCHRGTDFAGNSGAQGRELPDLKVVRQFSDAARTFR